MDAFLQNFLSEDWLSERVQENQSTLIAQLSTESAEEPDFWVHYRGTYVLSEGPGKPLRSPRLLLENGCNPGRSPGSKIEELGVILQALRPPYRQQVRMCLDTAHCWAVGYDLCSNMSQFLSLVEESIGFPSIQLIHLNDARHELGSSRDEHAQWGMGQISMRSVAGIQMLLQDPRLSHVELILETPLLKNENGLPDWEQEREHHALVKRLLLTPL